MRMFICSSHKSKARVSNLLFIVENIKRGVTSGSSQQEHATSSNPRYSIEGNEPCGCKLNVDSSSPVPPGGQPEEKN